MDYFLIERQHVQHSEKFLRDNFFKGLVLCIDRRLDDPVQQAIQHLKLGIRLRVRGFSGYVILLSYRFQGLDH